MALLPPESMASAPVCALTVSSKMQDLSPKVRKCSSLCTYGEHVEIFKFFKMKNVLTVGAQTGACAEKSATRGPKAWLGVSL